MKKIIIGLLVIVLLVGLYMFMNKKMALVCCDFDDPRNVSYFIDGAEYKMVNGKNEMEAYPGSAEKITTSIFGEPVESDLNADGTPDFAMYLIQETGGSGSFFFVASMINNRWGDPKTSVVYLGDRIAPQNIEIRDGVVIANYADRNPGEPFTVSPSLGVSKYFKVVDGELKEISNPNVVGGNEDETIIAKCTRLGGVWYDVSKICEVNRFSKTECEANGGEFNPCASACRHNPEAEMCTLQCVLVCEFK